MSPIPWPIEIEDNDDNETDIEHTYRIWVDKTDESTYIAVPAIIEWRELCYQQRRDVNLKQLRHWNAENNQPTSDELAAQLAFIKTLAQQLNRLVIDEHKLLMIDLDNPEYRSDIVPPELITDVI